MSCCVFKASCPFSNVPPQAILRNSVSIIMIVIDRKALVILPNHVKFLQSQCFSVLHGVLNVSRAQAPVDIVSAMLLKKSIMLSLSPLERAYALSTVPCQQGLQHGPLRTCGPVNVRFIAQIWLDLHFLIGKVVSSIHDCPVAAIR
jgi:hypothetical protein